MSRLSKTPDKLTPGRPIEKYVKHIIGQALILEEIFNIDEGIKFIESAFNDWPDLIPEIIERFKNKAARG